jgi:spermidine/putrescine transport system ATP-binding protein
VDVDVELVGVTKSFGDFVAVDDISFAVAKGSFFSLLGPSGCGKSTTLRMASGFEHPDRGELRIAGEDMAGVPPYRRPTNMVFQRWALFPHMTAAENVAFGLEVERRPRREIRERVTDALSLVGLGDFAQRKPGQLSGGQMQRVALARALVKRPKVLLLDEPLGALDLKLRTQMQLELKRIQREVGTTFIYVTHDQGEAMSISDRIAVMNKGIIEQVGPPTEIYEAPRSSFVAAFIGDTNFLDGKITDCIDSRFSRCEVKGFGSIVIDNDKPVSMGDRIHLSLRPEKLVVSREQPSITEVDNAVEGKVEDVIYYGSHTRYWVRCGEWRLCAEMQHRRYQLDESSPKWGDSVWLKWHANDGFLLEQYREEDEGMLTLPDAD